jgi:hypothetical protein
MPIVVLNVIIVLVHEGVLAKPEHRQDAVIKRFRALQIGHGNIDVVDADYFHVHRSRLARTGTAVKPGKTLQNHDNSSVIGASNGRRKGQSMKKFIDIKSLVLGALLGIAVVISIAAAPERGPGWEYKVVTGAIWGNEPKLDAVINNHVGQGWQFVATSGVGERHGYAVMRRDRE